MCRRYRTVAASRERRDGDDTRWCVCTEGPGDNETVAARPETYGPRQWQTEAVGNVRFCADEFTSAAECRRCNWRLGDRVRFSPRHEDERYRGAFDLSRRRRRRRQQQRQRRCGYRRQARSDGHENRLHRPVKAINRTSYYYNIV